MQVIIAQENGTLRDCIDASCPLASFAFTRLIRDRDIKVNGKRVDKNIAIFKGDKIEVYLTAKERAKEFYDIVYEDDDFLVVDKASGVSSEGLFQHLKVRVHGQITEQDSKQKRTSNRQELYFIHRLDRNTSGILLFAKREQAKEALLSAFKENKIYKEYHTIVVGDKFRQEQVKLTAYLKKDTDRATVQIYEKQTQGALKIITEYKVLRIYQGYAKLQVLLHTGRTHQIRAHLASVGYPVAGDEKYGDRAFNQKYHIKRQILVAKKVKLHLEKFPAMQNREFNSKYNAELVEKR